MPADLPTSSGQPLAAPAISSALAGPGSDMAPLPLLVAPEVHDLARELGVDLAPLPRHIADGDDLALTRVRMQVLAASLAAAFKGSPATAIEVDYDGHDDDYELDEQRILGLRPADRGDVEYFRLMRLEAPTLSLTLRGEHFELAVADLDMPTVMDEIFLAGAALAGLPDDWKNGAGGHGVAHMDVGSSVVTIRHNARIVSSVQTVLSSDQAQTHEQ